MSASDIVIKGRKIGRDHRPFIVAEMSGNHDQSLKKALAIVEAAAAAGADAVKLQTYTADTMTLDIDDREFCITDRNSLWHGYSLHRLYHKAHTPWEWHQALFERCKQLGLICFSTPFDASAVDFLESLDVPAYKVASFENTDLPLIRRIAATGKPMIVSSGMATVGELDESIRTARDSGCRDIIVLKCTSSYPASPANTNMLTIPHMRDLFEVQVGLSDHTLGVGVAVAAIALGATFVEKHFTLSRADGGVDAAFSLEPRELTMLVEETERAWQALGKVKYGVSEKERASLQFRRSLYVTRDMAAGEAFTSENLRSIRPGFGLSPRYYETLLGKRVGREVKRGTPATWELLG